MTDTSLLLQPFCTKAQFLNSKAKVDMIEKVAGRFNGKSLNTVISFTFGFEISLFFSPPIVPSHFLFPELVTELYPRKPQMVEQKVLPLLWHLLGTSTHSGTIHGRGGSVRGATANLCQALHAQMGSSLTECAASQPANVHKGLNEILRNVS